VALIDDFKARFPEFPTATVDAYLPILEPVWPCYYGRSYTTCPEIVLNLVAHLMVGEVAASQSAPQVVASKSVGSVSTSYAAMSHSGGALFDFFNTTKYGQRFWMLTRNKFGGVAV
jgi:hypothetical protein